MNIPAIFTGVLRKGVERFDGKDEREFLPAALEILETPPSPTGRFLALVSGSFFVIAYRMLTTWRIRKLPSASTV